ncbi:MAG: hypothetical protein N4A33_13290 [Bacteriovoracaceae bacterium]|jgi:hypothetical protein|nr:hypothetical protein [Bacteriovoracaceae bacterium]
MKILLVLMLAFCAYAQKKKIKYEYKKHESFDFSTLNVEGSLSSPGDLSINSRLKKRFRNKIPERKNFNKEMIRTLDIIK